MGNLGQANYNLGCVDIPSPLVDQDQMSANSFADTLRYWLSTTGQSQGEIADACGVTQGYVSLMVTGKKKPSIAILNKLAAHFGRDLAGFFGEPSCGLNDFTLVPKLTARPRGGFGGLETDADFAGWYSFKTNFLQRKGSPHSMYLFEVAGDSMSPTLLEKDMILVDTSKHEAVTGKIFLVRVDNEFMVKRVENRPGIIKLISDNKTYDPIEIESSEIDGVEIIGRMVWSCREY